MTNTRDDHESNAVEQHCDLETEAPYEETAVEQLPVWWSDAVEEFQEHDLPAYRPPRFADDVITPPVVDRLQSEYNAEIRFMGVGVEYRDSWVSTSMTNRYSPSTVSANPQDTPVIR